MNRIGGEHFFGLRATPPFANGLRVFNLDEVGTSTVQSVRTRIIALEGQRRVSVKSSGERGTLVTTCIFVSALGTVYPPAMIFPRKKFVPHMISGGYPGTLGLAYPSGWMEQTNFIHVLDRFVALTNSSKNNESLLIMDNLEAHITIEAIDLCKKNGVTILTLHPHTSHMCQPLDRTVFGPLSNAYDKAFNAWMIRNPGQTVTIYHIAALVKEAMEVAVTPDNTRSGFKACGIFPFNPQVFSEKDFKLSEETDRVQPLANQDGNENRNAQSSTNQDSNENPVAQSEKTVTLNEPILNEITEQIITPEQIAPHPKAPPRKENPKKGGRRKGKTMIATDTPVRNELQSWREAKGKKTRSSTVKAKSVSKKLFRPTEKNVDLDIDDDLEAMSIHSDKSCEGEGWGEETYSDSGLPMPDPTERPKLPRNPNEGDFVLVRFLPKAGRRTPKPTFYVGKILKEVHDEGDCEISYLRQSSKCKGKFVMPPVPDLKSVALSDMHMILPQPSVGTKRQQHQYSFDVNFSLVTLG